MGFPEFGDKKPPRFEKQYIPVLLGIFHNLADADFFFFVVHVAHEYPAFRSEHASDFREEFGNPNRVLRDDMIEENHVLGCVSDTFQIFPERRIPTDVGVFFFVETPPKYGVGVDSFRL
jgi:hypothetical protein